MWWDGDYYARGAVPGGGYCSGYRMGRVKSAEGPIEYSAPRIAKRDEPFCSCLLAVSGGRTEALQTLTRDIEALFARGGQSQPVEPVSGARDAQSAKPDLTN
jgi:putative transposase